MFSAILLDSTAVEQYAKKLSIAMVQAYFASPMAKISGTDLKSFSSIHQVNLLVIRQLFGKWQSEMAQLKSPYFDFQNEEVKEGLKRFMNLLSKHISIAEYDFLPLLESALIQTIELYANPVEWFTKEINKLSVTTVTQANVQELGKYLDTYKAVSEYVLEDMRSRNNAHMFKGEMSRLATFYINEYGQSLPRLEALIAAFSPIVPVSKEQLCGAKCEEIVVPVAETLIEPEVKEGNEVTSFFDSLQDSKIITEEPIELPQEEPAITLEPAEEVQATITLSSAINVSISTGEETIIKTGQTIVFSEIDSHEDSAPTALEQNEKQLKDMLKGEPQTNLNAQFAAAKEVPSFVKQVAGSETSMRRMIKMNDKFLFVEKLFQGKMDEYDAAIEEIDALTSKYDAMKFVLDTLAIHYNWDLNKKVPTQFVALVEKRFGE